jgi:hypothetical protein
MDFGKKVIGSWSPSRGGWLQVARIGDTIRAALIWRVFVGECKAVTPSVTQGLNPPGREME